jgi:hypothetical protein
MFMFDVKRLNQHHECRSAGANAFDTRRQTNGVFTACSVSNYNESPQTIEKGSNPAATLLLFVHQQLDELFYLG